LEHNPTRRRAQIEIVWQADERDAERRQLSEGVDEVFQGPTKSIDLPHQNGVKLPTACVGHQSIQRRAGLFAA